MSRPAPLPAPRAGDALVIVDVQNDFLAGGALAVAVLLASAVRAVDVAAGDGAAALAEMQRLGARVPEQAPA